MVAMIDLPPWDSPFYALATFLFGICVGSFLNVVIYRVPRGLSINQPKRSFCPSCKKEIPISRNIPLLTWLIQWGKCAECKCSILSRYFWIELLTGLLWLACWYSFPNPLLAIFYMLLGAIALVICAVDIELMLIPRAFTIIAAVIALIGGALMPERFGLLFTWKEGLAYSAFGLAIGWAALWLVVLLGKVMFGKRNFSFENTTPWELREPEEEDDEQEICFVIDDEMILWSDIFFRKSDKLIVDGLTELNIDGSPRSAKLLEIRDTYILVDGEKLNIEELKSLNGKTTSATIPREAMGMGDVDLLAVLGATFGAPSLLIIVLFSCIFTILIAFLGRLGFGKMIPFGPALIAGGVFWLLYGQSAWNWYMSIFVS
ncbi:MAG: leader peptidase (prepilin peptidase)/N-methyltransferase [Rubritalea sp.]|jgi:leader peptidase (prepilin peptidase)/N-methyltransferase